jgi:hypothetical protein
MARDDYSNFGNRGQRRGSENIDEREWQQGGDWQRQQGRQGWYSQGGGGYGQGWSGPSGFGQGGYTQGGGGYAGGSGQQWARDRSGWQGREGPGMYGQGSFGQGASGQGGYGAGGYGAGGYGPSGYGASGYGAGGYGAGGYGAGSYGAGGAGQGGYGFGGAGHGGYGLGGGRESSLGQGQGREYARRDYGMETARDTWGGGYGPNTGFTGQRVGPSFQRGQFAGRGPRGYQRSDDRIREDVNEWLTRHPEIDASDIDVTVERCEVTLTGVVEDRRDKRLAEDIAESVPGVNEVHNQLRPRKGIGEKISEMLTGGSDRDREGGRDREAGEARSRSGRSTSSTTT